VRVRERAYRRPAFSAARGFRNGGGMGVVCLSISLSVCLIPAHEGAHVSASAPNFDLEVGS